MTFDLFRLLFDYYSLRSIENSFESLRRNGSKLFYISLYFVRHTRKPAEMHSIRVRPHNSDSEGRRFKSCRAYQRQNNTMRSSAAAGGVRSTDSVVFPFRLKPTSLGFESVFVMSSKLTDPATSEQTRTVPFPLRGENRTMLPCSSSQTRSPLASSLLFYGRYGLLFIKS